MRSSMSNTADHSIVLRGGGALVLAAVCACAGPAAEMEAPASPRGGFDMSQARTMLGFLGQSARGPIDDPAVEAVMAAPGTALVIEQMNLARRVSAEQYETILKSVGEDRAPVLAPADETERARRGVVGLTENVWPVLRWGMAHLDVLERRLEEIEAYDVYETSRARALAMLPAPVDLSPPAFIVMGGRAGAAALPGGEIYVDILMLSFLDGTGRRPYSAESDLVDFIAHEMHHLGYREILADRRASLELTARDELAYGLLVSVVTEGSATYLISGRRDMERAIASDSGVAQLAERGDELLAEVERVLTAIEAGEITDREQYDAATGFLLGAGPHTVGSLMISRIDSGSGLEAVMEVLADPRRLLDAYNKAVQAGAEDTGVHVFDSDLAAAAASIGDG